MKSKRMQEHLKTVGNKRMAKTYQNICRWHPDEPRCSTSRLGGPHVAGSGWFAKGGEDDSTR